MEGMGKGVILLICFVAFTYPVYAGDNTATNVQWKDLIAPIAGVIVPLFTVVGVIVSKYLSFIVSTFQKELKEEEEARKKLETDVSVKIKEEKEFFKDQFKDLKALISQDKAERKEEAKNMDADLKETNKNLSKVVENLNAFIERYKVQEKISSSLKSDVEMLKEEKAHNDVWKNSIEKELESIKSKTL